VLPETGPPFDEAVVRAAAREWLEDLRERCDGRAWFHGSHLPAPEDPGYANAAKVERFYRFKVAEYDLLLGLLDGRTT